MSMACWKIELRLSVALAKLASLQSRSLLPASALTACPSASLYPGCSGLRGSPSPRASAPHRFPRLADPASRALLMPASRTAAARHEAGARPFRALL